MKKLLFNLALYAFVICVLILSILGILAYKRFIQPSEATITAKPVVVNGTYISPANLKQLNASVKMGTYNGKLYVIPEKGSGISGTKYQYSLCVFSDGDLTKLLDLKRKNLSVIVMSDGFLYFSSGQNPDKLFSFSLETEALKELFSLSCLSDVDTRQFSSNIFRSEDGALFFPVISLEKEEQVVVHVKGNEASGYKPTAETYRLGDREYYIKHEDVYDTVYYQGADGQEYKLPLEHALERSIIRTDHGILIHNMRSSGRGVMLYYVTEDNALIELFVAPQLSSVSAVTVYHDVVYLSFIRSEKYGKIGELGFDNDDLIGTWRISLTDYSAKKLSDNIYNGLYIFDDTGIYACDYSCSIYKLDYDGLVIDTLMKVTH